MSIIPFVYETDVSYGLVTPIEPGIRRCVARNPGPFTYTGTATYIVGEGQVAVLDPGPADEDHIKALLNGLDGETVSHILITHTHRDHSPGAKLLAEATGAPTFGYGPHGSGREGAAGVVEEGGDLDFVPDTELRDGDRVTGAGWTLQALHTPGHTSNHLCFAHLETNVLFVGDHVMGWSTSVISPPDGEMGRYRQSLRRLLERDDRLYLPAHGPGICDPKPFVEAYLAHRASRETQILKAIKAGARTSMDVVPTVYKDLDARLYPAAARSVEAHLIDMQERGLLEAVETEGDGMNLAYQSV